MKGENKVREAAKKIAILYLIDSLENGGAEMHLYKVMKSLDRKRFQPVVCCLRNKNGVGEKIERLGIKVVELGLPKIYTRKALRKVAALRKLAREHRVRILHTYLNSANVFGPLALGDLRARGLKIVLSRRDDGFELSPEMERLQRTVANALADRILTVSHGIRRMTIRHWSIPPQKIRALHNGVELPELNQSGKSEMASIRQQADLPEDAFVVGAVGILRPVKGLELLLRAAAILLSESAGFYFLFLGDGPEREKLERLSADFGIAEHCRFMGDVHAVDDWYPLIDVMVSTSYTEGISNSILEAMAHGRPVIATAVGGTPEIIENVRDGILLDNRNPGTLAQHLLVLWKDADKRALLGKNARQKVAREFSLSYMIDELQQEYEDLLQGNGRKW